MHRRDLRHGQSTFVTDYPIVRRQLSNGLRVVVTEDHTVPVVAVNTTFSVGSRHESKGRTGFAHLFEHLLLQAADSLGSGEPAALLRRHGGNLNAATSFDRTTYYETVPSGTLELALWLGANRMKILSHALDQYNLDRQRKVVKEERSQVVDNQPYGTALERALSVLFPEGHPYDHPPIGSLADLDRATVDDVLGFFQRHYTPSRAVISLAGDITAEQGLELVERYCGDLSAGPAAAGTISETLPPLATPTRHEILGVFPSAALFVAFRAPAEPDNTLDALELAVSILATGGTCRLYKRMIRDSALAQAVSAGVERLVDGNSYTQLTLIGAPGTPVQQIEDALVTELERLATHGPTDEELAAAQAQTERRWLSRMGRYAGRAAAVSEYTTLFGAPELVNRRVQAVHAVTAEQVRTSTANWLAPRHRAVVAFRSKDNR